jgi:hypothetical protein
MKIKNLVLLAALTLFLQGCLFFYIPGSVTSAVSDSITGSEGNNCVGANAKVGDKIRLPGGGVGTIKSLSGTSVRCTNPELPIRALLGFPDDNAAAQEPAKNTSKIGLTLPTGWEQKTLTQQMVVGNGVLYAINRTTDTGLLLSANKREGITDLMAFAVSREGNQASRLIDPQQSQVSKIEVNGKVALRFDVAGSNKNGLKLTYMVTIIEGVTEIAILNTWTASANFEKQKEAMESLGASVTGL